MKVTLAGPVANSAKDSTNLPTHSKSKGHPKVKSLFATALTLAVSAAAVHRISEAIAED